MVFIRYTNPASLTLLPLLLLLLVCGFGCFGGDEARPPAVSADCDWTMGKVVLPTIRRLSEALPLSDQADAGHWVLDSGLTDEFNGDSLDASKWQTYREHFPGPRPAVYIPRNVSVSKGNLQITLRKESVPFMSTHSDYHDYTAGYLQSKSRVLYGYFEVRAKPMPSAGSSAFWFSNLEGISLNEIDVFEIGGRYPAKGNRLFSTVHVWRTPERNGHWSRSGTVYLPFDTSTDFHVYGLNWDANDIQVYFDGTLVRRICNTNWHDPLAMIFDTEVMAKWWGVPLDADLPSTYLVDYVRSWRHSN